MVHTGSTQTADGGKQKNRVTNVEELEEERPIVYVCVPMPVLNSFSYHDTTSGVGLAFRSSYRVVWYGLCSHWDGLREFEVKSYRVRS